MKHIRKYNEMLDPMGKWSPEESIVIMRYIKTYESYDDIKSQIMECFYDLVEDDEFKVEIDEKEFRTNYFSKIQDPGFLVFINRRDWDTFAYTTINPYVERLENHIEDKYKLCLIEVTIPNSRGQASVDMSEWLSKSKEEQENSYVGTMDDEIFSECIIYLEEK